MRVSPLSLILALAIPAAAQTYRVSDTIPLGGEGAWDYLRADPEARRLYVSHSTEVDVLDLDTHKLVGKMTGFGFIHGIVIVKSLHKGFLSDGQKNEVVTFDPASLTVTGHIKTDPNPNSMVYNDETKRLFVGHKPTRSMTVIKAATNEVENKIAVSGIPEFPVTDGRNVFVNIEDRNEILMIDARSLSITRHMPVAPCKGPGGLAINRTMHRLFSACDNNLMAIVNTDSGMVVSTLPIGSGPDAAYFDPVSHLAFSSNGDGTLTIIEDQGSDHYRVAQNVPTLMGARTMGFDEKTHTAFLSTAKLGPPPAPTTANPHPPTHPTALPGSFKLVVVSPGP